MQEIEQHILKGAMSSILFYIVGIINKNQIVPYFIGSSSISYLTDEHIKNQKKNK